MAVESSSSQWYAHSLAGPSSSAVFPSDPCLECADHCNAPPAPDFCPDCPSEPCSKDCVVVCEDYCPDAICTDPVCDGASAIGWNDWLCYEPSCPQTHDMLLDCCFPAHDDLRWTHPAIDFTPTLPDILNDAWQRTFTFAFTTPATTIPSLTRSPSEPTEPSDECASVTTSSPQEHACLWDGCTAHFDTSEDLTAHLADVHVGNGKNTYECRWDRCSRHGDKSLTSKQKVLRHLQSHTGHRPFKCDHCNQYFSESATLQQHLRRHTNERPYICDYPGCGKAFAITGALTIHKRVHSGEKPFKCTYCDRSFAESSNLSKHLRTHTGARPYACVEDGCGKRFARPDQLSRHQSVHRKREQKAGELS
ncbi:hypothetical protein BS47DRAFT_1338851 [Hydnum rufescens UP504]|uniref:pH-response transcription factor pacC/RIM101 n=1 Tax=Hydnum rufescens UP504 TaxID=1448309 RepID=A0A9P6B831_9AGAM|nr:hypothetical protein BS47DRAFT_1338851 [Hydnum rufescens UP504]